MTDKQRIKELETTNRKLREELYDIHAVAEDARSHRDQLKRDASLSNVSRD